MSQDGHFWTKVWLYLGGMITLIVLASTIYNVYDGKRDENMAKLGYSKTEVSRCTQMQVFTEWTK